MAIVSVALPEESRLLHTLGLLASGLARQPVAVQALARAPASAPAPGQAHALPPRAVLISQPARLLVPANLPMQAHLHAATTAHAAAHLRFSPARQDSSALKPMGQAVVGALEDARVERLLCLQHPGVRRWFEACIAPEPDPSDLGFAAFMARLDRMLLWPERMDGNHWIHKARDLFENTATRHGLEDYAAFRAIASILANDLGQMRVRMDPQHHAVPSIYRDDNSYLWQHPESPQGEEDTLALQQSAARAAPPPSAGAGQQSDAQEGQSLELNPGLELSRHSYPEWDRRSERLKTDWCTVIDTLPAWQAEALAGKSSQAGRQTLPHLPLPPARQLDRRQRLRRQWEGDDLDFNAAIEVQVDRRLNLRPEPRLFMRAGKGPRPTSLLVLMDASESVNTPAPPLRQPAGAGETGGAHAGRIARRPRDRRGPPGHPRLFVQHARRSPLPAPAGLRPTLCRSSGRPVAGTAGAPFHPPGRRPAPRQQPAGSRACWPAPSAGDHRWSTRRHRRA